MNLKIHLTILAALALAMHTQAAGTAPKTNNVMTLNFTLTAWPGAMYLAGPVPAAALDTSVPVGERPFRISSKDIVAALNGVTNDGVGYHFASNAQLLFKQIISSHTVTTNGLGTNQQIIVRQKVSGHTEDTDVSSFFSNALEYVTFPTGNEVLSTFSMTGGARLDFTLSALASKTTVLKGTNEVPVIKSIVWNVQGNGFEGVPLTTNWSNLILGGAIRTGPAHLE